MCEHELCGEDATHDFVFVVGEGEPQHALYCWPHAFKALYYAQFKCGLTPISPLASLKRGIEEASRGELVDRGSFAQYLSE